MAMTRLKRLSLCLLLGLLSGCGNDDPVNVGFIGGVSGRVADLGIGGRNGVILALEEQNQQGGIHGRPLRLFIEDDHQDPETARAAFSRLLAHNPAAVLGPMTSAIAEAIVPLANEERMLLMGLTVTANSLAGIDDFFFSTLAPTQVHAGRNASHAVQRGIHRVTIAYDVSNRAFSESWMEDFRYTLEQDGGHTAKTVGFVSSHETDYEAVARELLDPQPDGVVLISNSVDTALLAKQVRTLAPRMPIVISEWGGTERLIELAGRYVEGVVVGQFFDRYDNRPTFRAFQKRYQDRFGASPGFAAVIGYNAARVLIDSLLAQEQDEPLKETLLRLETFDGLQAKIRFDRAGNTNTRTYLTEIRNGHFMALE